MIIITKNLGEPAKGEGKKGSSVSVATPQHGDGSCVSGDCTTTNQKKGKTEMKKIWTAKAQQKMLGFAAQVDGKFFVSETLKDYCLETWGIDRALHKRLLFAKIAGEHAAKEIERLQAVVDEGKAAKRDLDRLTLPDND